QPEPEPPSPSDATAECVLRDAVLRTAPRDEGRPRWHHRNRLILRSARRARLEGRTTFLQPHPSCARSRGAAAMREGGLLAGDEFEERRPAALIDPPRAQDRAGDLARLRHPLAPATEILRQIGVVAAEIARPVLLVRQRHRMRLD